MMYVWCLCEGGEYLVQRSECGMAVEVYKEEAPAAVLSVQSLVCGPRQDYYFCYHHRQWYSVYSLYCTRQWFRSRYKCNMESDVHGNHCVNTSHNCYVVW